MNKKWLTLFNIRNPWQKNKKFLVPKNYISRNLENKLKPHLNSDDISIIYGSRQIGKTTLVYKLIQDLHEKGASRRDLFYFSADDKLFRDTFKEPSSLLGFVMERKKKKAYIFIDEAQRMSNPGIFLKNLYDYKIKDIKIIATGSSSLEIKSKIIEYLPGRKKVFMLYPLSFGEIREYKGLRETEAIKKAWQEYLIYGAYPKVFLAPNSKDKKQELNDIYESYIKKDISGYLNIEKPAKFNHLALLLADQIGGLININELTNTLALNRATLEKYITMLEDTFAVKKVFPFFQNPRTEITKMPKIYFLDLGLRNAILKRFNKIDERTDTGKLAENYVFSQFEYNKDIDTEINFWRTKSGAEIDFVVRKGDGIDLFEVKYNRTLSNNHTVSINSFKKKYKINKASIITQIGLGSGNNLLSFWDIK